MKTLDQVREAMAPQAGNPPSIEWRAVGELSIDHDYQRTVMAPDSQDQIRRIALAWDWRLCGLLMVSRRDGKLFVIDGQHRLEAARARGDIAHMPCVIAAFESQAAEAECFVAINSRRRPLSPVALFRAALAAQEPSAVSLDRILVSVGLGITAAADWRAWSNDQVPIIGLLRKYQDRFGDTLLTRALTVYAEGFRGSLRRHAGAILSAIVGLSRGGGQIDDDLLIGVLAGQDAISWEADFRDERLRTGNSSSAAATEVLRRSYWEAAAE